MAPKKASPDSKESKKNSPKKDDSTKGKKESSKSKKDSPKSKKNSPVEDIAPFWPEPRAETPPPLAPRGLGMMYVKRQPWYPYINNPDFTYREYSWNPFCPLITSWGHLWVSDPQNRKIWRYNLDPCFDDLIKLPDIVTKGEPYQLIETPNTGRVLALICCRTAHMSTLTQFSPEGEIENVREYKFDMNPDDAIEEHGKLGVHFDEGRPIGITVDNETIYVLRNPIQRMELLHYRKLAPVPFQLQGWSKTEPFCIHLSTSGGCAAGNGFLYVAATRPARIVVFQIVKEMCYRVVDRITVSVVFEFGMERMKQPCCLRLDSLFVLAVSDSQWGFLRAFHNGGVETSSFGGWKVDELRLVRPGHFSTSKNGIVCLIDHHHNHIIFYIDRVMFRWYRDTLFYIDKMAWTRPIVDKEMPPLPPTRRPEPLKHIKGFDFVQWPLDDPDGVWPRPSKEVPALVEQDDKKESKKKSPDSKKKGKNSPPSKNKSSSKKIKK